MAKKKPQKPGLKGAKGAYSALGGGDSAARKIKKLEYEKKKILSENMDLRRVNKAIVEENERLLAHFNDPSIKAMKYDVLRPRSQSEAVRRPDEPSPFDERASVWNRLQVDLGGQAESRLRMFESYRGEVVDVGADRIVVVYDVKGSVVEQTYERNQFLEGRLPEVGTELGVYVIVAEIGPQTAGEASQEDERGDEVSSSRRKPLSEPTIF